MCVSFCFVLAKFKGIVCPCLMCFAWLFCLVPSVCSPRLRFAMTDNYGWSRDGGMEDWANCYSPHAVEAIVGSINGQHWGACVRFGHATIPLEDDHFGPDLVVNLGPFVQHFLNVLLKDNP